MTILHLGVLDVPYKATDEHSLPETTGQVASKLEYQYSVMRVFFNTYEKEISELVLFEMKTALENMALGSEMKMPLQINTSKLDTLFNRYLANDEWQKITGKTILAAKLGHSKRFKDRFNEKKLRGPRPAFIDSGLYQASFKSWVDDKLVTL